MQYLTHLYKHYNHEINMLLIMLILLIPTIIFIKKCIFSPIKTYLINHHYEEYERVLKKYSLFRYLLHSLLGLYFVFWGNIFRSSSIASHILMHAKDIVVTIYTSASITFLILGIIDAAEDIYQHRNKTFSKKAPLSLYFQIVKIIVFAIAALITISYVLNISLSTFLTSLGAAAALLTFVFKDAMLGLLASLQLTSQSIIRIGDWIRIGDIEGNVEKITISVVSIRNFDQSISTIPTYNIVSSNVTNYRGISESGARRIQRVLYINMSSIRFCTPEDLKELKKSPYLTKSLLDNIDSKATGNITNIQLFKAYIQSYLKTNPMIYQEGFTFLVRELAPTAEGLPIEVYVFIKETGTYEYENIQGEIFDHLLSILPEFKLKVFQNAGI